MSKIGEPTRDVFESGRRGLSHVGVRRANERTVLTVVGFNAGVSNAEISRLSGLAPQTVSAILVDLEREGLILRGPVLRGRRGQPATPIMLDPDGGFAIGIEVGWRHMDVVLLNMHAQVLARHHVDYAYPDGATLVDTIATVIEQFTGGLRPEQRARLMDLGLAMPGDLAAGLDALGAPAEQIALWQELDLVAALGARTGLAITRLNDGNAGCWAELIALAPPRPANIIYVLVSHFIAAGIVGDGALWEGPTGNAAELGAMLVNPAGGRPQLAHRIASIWALRNSLDAAGHDAGAMPARDLDPDLAGAAGWMNTTAQALAQVLFNANTVVEQPLVIIDTVLAPAVSARLAGLVEAEMARLPSRPHGAPRVIAGQLGGLAPAIGAAELPLFRRYF
ncbi:ROK family transcriptional regulator [Devosia sediminis]|uniref:ROK family transcriptional regulator n=1 Tax=Devosia sediminis TaxID=2798801 RepID=A0A934J1K7_9HYPH|nr:ROK family transcriptional regulator [Devosia sediminis]MBJ3785954.1 ROK family transcriptional regulator [Devosia sediminis]